MTTQYGFFIDSSRCTGCKTCELACKDYKDLTPDVSFRRIYEYAGGDWQEDNGVWHQNVFAYYLSIACNHCEDPACTKVCPSGAMHKREDGFVVVDEDVCIGCRYCHMACPYGWQKTDLRRVLSAARAGLWPYRRTASKTWSACCGSTAAVRALHEAEYCD